MSVVQMFRCGTTMLNTLFLILCTSMQKYCISYCISIDIYRVNFDFKLYIPLSANNISNF